VARRGSEPVAATRYIVDTHALLWYIADDPALGADASAVLDDPASELVLPAIVFAEACFIIERRRVRLALSELRSAVDRNPRITFIPLDRDIVERATALTSIEEMHDRQIVATALSLSNGGDTAALLTKDKNITRSGIVPVVW
jgi:PIN domain nuclease of toxin-antitoxin system